MENGDDIDNRKLPGAASEGSFRERGGGQEITEEVEP